MSDEIILAKHRSGLRFTLAPDLDGTLKIWIDLHGGAIADACTCRNRAKFAQFLREAAKRIERV